MNNKWMRFRSLSTATILGAIAISAGAPAEAALVADGLTYTLTESALSSTEDQFILSITGINGPSDTERGRYGVNSLAFSQPTPKGVSTGSLAGFTFMMGGLNAMGCNGTGSFYCFLANTAPSSPALPANSTLEFTFNVTLKTGDTFAGYNPSFKIQWLGTNSSYDLVSQTLTPTVVPLPAALPLLLFGLGGLGVMARRRKAVHA